MSKNAERKARKPKATSYGHGYNSDNSIAIIWTIEDVQQVIENNDILNRAIGGALNDDDCKNVLYQVHNNHDANYGISWDSIFYVLMDFYDEEIKKAEEEESQIREQEAS